MKALALLSLIGGALLATLLVWHYGVASVGQTLARVGWTGFAAIIAIHLGLLALMGIAWAGLADSASPARSGVFIWGRLVRDSASEILPLSQVGGYVVGARAIVLGGVSAANAAATTIADVTTEVVAQLVYTGIGLVLLEWLHPDNGFARPALGCLALMSLLIGAFVAVQRRGIGLPARFAGRLSRRWLGAFGGVDAAERALHAIHGRPAALALCFLLHLTAWVASGLEIWLALRFMGVPLGIAPVLALESLLYGARSIAFMVPNAVGVQEGAYVALGALFGLGPDGALAVSLLKRGRDLAIGIPVLLAWQAVEGGRAWRRLAAAKAAPGGLVTAGVEGVDRAGETREGGR